MFDRDSLNRCFLILSQLNDANYDDSIEEIKRIFDEREIDYKDKSVIAILIISISTCVTDEENTNPEIAIRQRQEAFNSFIKNNIKSPNLRFEDLKRMFSNFMVWPKETLEIVANEAEFNQDQLSDLLYFMVNQEAYHESHKHVCGIADILVRRGANFSLKGSSEHDQIFKTLKGDRAIAAGLGKGLFLSFLHHQNNVDFFIEFVEKFHEQELAKKSEALSAGQSRRSSSSSMSQSYTSSRAAVIRFCEDFIKESGAMLNQVTTQLVSRSSVAYNATIPHFLLSLINNKDEVVDGGLVSRLWSNMQSQRFFERNIDPRIFTKSNFLHEIIKSQNRILLEAALAKIKRLDPDDIRAVMSSKRKDRIPFIYACELGWDTAIEALEEYLDPIDTQTINRGLLTCIRIGYVASAEILMRKMQEKGLSIDGDDFNATIIKAIECNQETILRRLIEKGADVNRDHLILQEDDPRPKRICPLQYAIEMDNKEMVIVLLEAGARFHDENLDLLRFYKDFKERNPDMVQDLDKIESRNLYGKEVRGGSASIAREMEELKTQTNDIVNKNRSLFEAKKIMDLLLLMSRLNTDLQSKELEKVVDIVDKSRIVSAIPAIAKLLNYNQTECSRVIGILDGEGIDRAIEYAQSYNLSLYSSEAPSSQTSSSQAMASKVAIPKGKERK